MEGALHATFACDTDPTDAAFCDPSTGLVACGTMGGKVLLFSLEGGEASAGKAAPVRTFDLLGGDRDSRRGDGGDSTLNHGDHENAVRALDIVDSGRGVCAGMYDATLCLADIETGAVIQRLRPDLDDDVDPKEHSISRVLCLDEIFENGQIVASGDESGTVALWDARCSDRGGSAACFVDLTPHDDFISDMMVVPGKKSLLTTSGDGTLSLIDVRMKHGGGYAMKLKHRTEEDADDELLSVAVVRAGQKVVCGTTSGVLNIYSWGAWNDCSDRFPGHPDSVTSVIAIDEETVLTGSSDGLIRVVNIQPNKFLGVLGEHSEFDIERLVMRKDKAFLASISHDPNLKIWNTSILMDDEEGDGDDAADKDGNDPDIKDDSVDNSDAESDSDGDGGHGSKRRKKKKNKGAHKIPKRAQQTAKDAAANFFADLI